MKNTKKTPETYPCKECIAGVMRPQYITYFTWLNDELITVPNFPAWICDLCGKREYDQHAISWLTTLLEPDAGKAPKSKQKPHPYQRATDSASPAVK